MIHREGRVMAEYTPPTEEMADAYTQMRVREATDETPGEKILTAVDALAEFERGLAAHDREVRRQVAAEARALRKELASWQDSHRLVEEERDHLQAAVDRVTTLATEALASFKATMPPLSGPRQIESGEAEVRILWGDIRAALNDHLGGE